MIVENVEDCSINKPEDRITTFFIFIKSIFFIVYKVYISTGLGTKFIQDFNVSTSNLLVISQNNNLHHRSMLATDAVIRNMV